LSSDDLASKLDLHDQPIEDREEVVEFLSVKSFEAKATEC
jgi:hypothetical protein